MTLGDSVVQWPYNTLVIVKVHILDPYWLHGNAAHTECAGDMYVPLKDVRRVPIQTTLCLIS